MSKRAAGGMALWCVGVCCVPITSAAVSRHGAAALWHECDTRRVVGYHGYAAVRVCDRYAHVGRRHGQGQGSPGLDQMTKPEDEDHTDD